MRKLGKKCNFRTLSLAFAEKAATHTYYWTRRQGTPAVNTWLGLAYERVCLAHIPQISEHDGTTIVNAYEHCIFYV